MAARSSYRAHIVRKSQRLLAFFLFVVVTGLSAVFWTGNRSLSPKLGIDLQGGTMVVLTPRTITGQPPSKDQLHQAKNIIESRVNGRGITGAEVVISGSNIQITIPGDDKGLARNLGATAQMFVRPVHNARQNIPDITNTPPKKAKPEAPKATSTPPTPSREKPSPTHSTSPMPSTQASAPTHPVVRTPASSAKASSSAQPTRNSINPSASAAAQIEQGYTQEEVRKIAQAKESRQSTDQRVLDAAFAKLTCSTEDPLRGNDDPALPLVTCSQDGKEVYELDPAIIKGSDITDAGAARDFQTNQNVVNLNFSGPATTIWGKYTTEHLYGSAAFTLDTQVISAPVIRSAILDGRTQISGNFTFDAAHDLAMQLKFGGLPLSFDIGQAETISATLGIASLHAGLIAGLVGLLAVLLYSCFYYRFLTVLVGISLLSSLLLVYIVFVLFGRWINLTLDLSGIAGLIIGIGMTADSFVVYFERIKDEIRAGRSIRSAVAPAWKRAQHTILSGNSVSFIAAAVLYYLAAGAVRGFAFTLGLTSLLDLAIVYLVTDPLMELVVQSDRLTKNPSRMGFASVITHARKERDDELSTPVGKEFSHADGKHLDGKHVGGKHVDGRHVGGHEDKENDNNTILARSDKSLNKSVHRVTSLPKPRNKR